MQLVAARKARGLTQKALAERLQIDQSRVSQIETDPSRVSFALLLAWLRVLNLRLSLLDLLQEGAPRPAPALAPVPNQDQNQEEW